MNRKVIVASVAAAGLAATAWMLFSTKPENPDWQGWIEADLLFIGPDDAGRLTELDVTEGQEVDAGSRLFRVESDIQDADLRQSVSAVAEAKARLARLEAAQQRPEEIEILEAQRRAAAAAIEQSQPELERAEKLVALGTSPQTRLDQARAAYNRDKAQLASIDRQIEVARLKSRTEDIKAAREVVAQSEARLEMAETRSRQRTVEAPARGHIQEVFYRRGEIVPAGRPVVSLLPPGNLKARFFVAQAQLPRFSPGARVNISCDGCASDLGATVSFVSQQAEFTPPVIYSREERSKLVYRIEALPNDSSKLRVGQPITVTLANDQVASREGSNGRH